MIPPLGHGGNVEVSMVASALRLPDQMTPNAACRTSGAPRSASTLRGCRLLSCSNRTFTGLSDQLEIYMVLNRLAGFRMVHLLSKFWSAEDAIAIDSSVK